MSNIYASATGLFGTTAARTLAASGRGSSARRECARHCSRHRWANTQGTFGAQESFGTPHVLLLVDGVEQNQTGLLLLTRFAMPHLSMLARAS